MKKTISTIILWTLIIATYASTITTPFNWKVKEDVQAVTFKGGMIEGSFKGLKASIVFDDANLSNSKILATIEVKSIDAGNWLKTKHARSALGADGYPLIKFESISISKNGQSYEALGHLTIKNVTKKIILPFTIAKNNNEAVFAGKFSITSKDFNITRMGSPDIVEISLTVPATR